MRILLVDDEPLALERLQGGLAEIPQIEIVGVATSGTEALEKIAALSPDLVLLDIQMPEMTGIEVAEKFTDAAARPDIIFLTAFDRFAVQAFGLEAADYLRKPVCFDRLRTAVDRVRRRKVALPEADAVGEFVPQTGASSFHDARNAGYRAGFWLPWQKGSAWVPVGTIDRLEGARDYVIIKASTQNYIIRAKMGEMEKSLDPALMMRVHRSHIVRIEAVNRIERMGRGSFRLVLMDGTSIQVGASYRDKVLDTLRQRGV